MAFLQDIVVSDFIDEDHDKDEDYVQVEHKGETIRISLHRTSHRNRMKIVFFVEGEENTTPDRNWNFISKRKLER